MNKLLNFVILAIFCKFSIADEPSVPGKFSAFIKPDEKLIQYEQSDLNSDGILDFLLVLEKMEPSDSEGERSLLIITGDNSGNLSLAKRNDKVIYCLSCGGALGDPFASIEVGKNTFTVNHYGGSAWRWTSSYKFNYSRRDNSWQLVKVVKESFHATDQGNVEEKTFIPPKDFGLIDIAEFNPENFIGTGKK
jgi:hypothetical protein